METINIKINVKELIESNPDIDIEGWIKKTFGLSDNNEESSKKEFDQPKVLEIIKAINSMLIGKEEGKEIFSEVYSLDYKDKTKLKIYLKTLATSIPLIIEKMQELELEVLTITNEPLYKSHSFCFDIRRKN